MGDPASRPRRRRAGGRRVFDEAHRRRGIGRALVEALRNLLVDRGCHGMWVGTEPDNRAAISTYRAAGADQSVTLTWTFPTSASSEH
ncbi:MAG: GNAT family N-acetyltransferase [Acidimicrobiia bacterium]